MPTYLIYFYFIFENVDIYDTQHKKIARAIYDVEEATSKAFDIILENKVCHFPLIVLLFLLILLDDRTNNFCLADDKTRNSSITYKVSSAFGSSSSF